MRNAYLQIAREEPERVRIIDASGSIDETHARVLEVVMPIIKSRESIESGESREKKASDSLDSPDSLDSTDSYV